MIEEKDEVVKILDLGCGPQGEAIKGLKDNYREQVEAWGVDLEINNNLDSRVNLVEADIKSLPFADESFDIVFESFVLRYFKNQDEFRKVMTEVMRLLRPSGKFIITFLTRGLIENIEQVLNSLNVEYEISLIEPRNAIIIEKKSSLTNNSAASADELKTGGIDFRKLPAAGQPLLKALPPAMGQPLAGINIKQDEEWLQLQKMIQAGIIPSNERIKEYLADCCKNDNINQGMDKIIVCIAEILKLEEDRCLSTPAEIKDFLVLLESDKPADEIQSLLSGIDISPKEPAFIGAE